MGSPATVFKELLSRDKLPFVTLVVSDDNVRKGRVVSAFIKKFYPCSKDLGTVTRLSGSSWKRDSLAKLKEALQSQSLFSNNQTLIIESLELLKAEQCREIIDVLERAQAGLCDSCVILCGSKIASNSVLLTWVNKHGASLIFSSLEGAELKRWVERELKYFGVLKYQQKIPDLLIELGESSPDLITALIERLGLYLDSEEEATSLHLGILFSERMTPNDYILLDAIALRNPSKRETVLFQLLQSGKSPFLLLSMLSRTYQNYATVLGMQQQKMDAMQIRNTLKLQPWLYNKIASAATKYTQVQLLDCQKALLRADGLLKNKSLGALHVLSGLMEKLAPDMGRRPA